MKRMNLVVMAVSLSLMSGMVMIVWTMFTLVVVIVDVRRVLMGMFVAVLVQVFMGVAVGMFVSVFLVAMSMLVTVRVSVLVRM